MHPRWLHCLINVIMGTIASVLQWSCINCNIINPTESLKCLKCGTVRQIREISSGTIGSTSPLPPPIPAHHQCGRTTTTATATTATTTTTVTTTTIDCNELFSHTNTALIHLPSQVIEYKDAPLPTNNSKAVRPDILKASRETATTTALATKTTESLISTEASTKK